MPTAQRSTHTNARTTASVPMDRRFSMCRAEWHRYFQGPSANSPCRSDLPLRACFSGPAIVLALARRTGHYAPVVDPSAETLSEAIVAWTGYGVTSYPMRGERRVVEQFGVEAAVELVPLIVALEKDFYRSTAHRTVPGLAEMVAQAASEFRQRHPDLSDDAVKAFAWCYSWDWK